jgi:hypothetical protein
MRRTAVAALGLGLALAAGCPDASSVTPNPAGNTTPPPVAPVTPPPPPAPPPRPKVGWGAVGVGSTFETVTRTHFENGALPDSERTTIQTVVGFGPDSARVHSTTTEGGVVVSEDETPYPFANDAPDPDAKKPATTPESVTVKAGTFDCECTSETADDATTRTWRTKALPVPVKIEQKSPTLTSTAELVRAEVK